jgi:hypothetical protein
MGKATMTAVKTARVTAIAGRVWRMNSPAVTPRVNANAAYPVGATPAWKPPDVNGLYPEFAWWMGLAHQFAMRLNSSAAAMAASPAMASLAASQRVRLTPWVHARRKAPVSNSGARRSGS